TRVEKPIDRHGFGYRLEGASLVPLDHRDALLLLRLAELVVVVLLHQERSVVGEGGETSRVGLSVTVADREVEDRLKSVDAESAAKNELVRHRACSPVEVSGTPVLSSDRTRLIGPR